MSNPTMGPVALTPAAATGGQEVSLDIFAKDVARGSDEARLALAQQLKDAGLWKGNISSKFDIKYYGALVKLEEQYQGQIALNKLLGVPAATTRYDALASLLADGRAGGTAKTRVSKTTRLSDATTAEALVTAVMQDQVGRGPSTAELKKYTQALQKAQATAPTTTVTTGGATTSTSQTTGGINEQQFLINEIAGDRKSVV